tara:strand:+ start:4047 stop:4334 length:288 start_codon:yes stop_codon:yes gene_type:complete
MSWINTNTNTSNQNWSSSTGSASSWTATQSSTSSFQPLSDEVTQFVGGLSWNTANIVWGEDATNSSYSVLAWSNVQIKSSVWSDITPSETEPLWR